MPTRKIQISICPYNSDIGIIYHYTRCIIG
jgi:hypothetical protein